MKKIGLLIMLASATFMFSCSGNKKHEDKKAEEPKKEEVVTPHDNAKTSLDYEGTYKGTLPAADGDMVVEIKLDRDGNYKKQVTYSKNASKPVVEEGKYKWLEDGNTIELEGIKDAPNKYKVTEGAIIQLDMEGKVIEGNIGAAYVLKKEQ